MKIILWFKQSFCQHLFKRKTVKIEYFPLFYKVCTKCKYQIDDIERQNAFLDCIFDKKYSQDGSVIISLKK